MQSYGTLNLSTFIESSLCRLFYTFRIHFAFSRFSAIDKQSKCSLCPNVIDASQLEPSKRHLVVVTASELTIYEDESSTELIKKVHSAPACPLNLRAWKFEEDETERF